MENEIMTYAHFRLGRGRVTAAIRQNAHVPNLYDVGLSLCSPKEQFVKRLGRERAADRLLGRVGYGVGVHSMIIRVKPEDAISRSQMKTVVKDAIANAAFGIDDPNIIVSVGPFPGWARKADYDFFNRETTEHEVNDLRRWLGVYDTYHAPAFPDFLF